MLGTKKFTGLLTTVILSGFVACGDRAANPYNPYDRSPSLRITGTVVWPDCTPANDAIVWFYAADCTGFVWDACPKVMFEATDTRANGSYHVEVTLDDCTRLNLRLWAQAGPDSAGHVYRSPSVEATCEAEQQYDFVLGDMEQCDAGL